MRAQVSLIPAESKKLIAKAVARLDVVKKALNDGILVMHPSSGTIFLVEEITGQSPGTDIWVCGMIVPKGACSELAASRMFPPGEKRGPSAFPASWVIKDGKFETGFTHTCMATGAKWFIKKRSRALSFISAGGGIGGAVMVPFLAWLIAQYGWRPAAVIAGLMILLLGFPAAFIMRSTPEEKGLMPDGDVVAPSPKATAAAQITGLEKQSRAADASAADFTVREVLRTRTYWTYAVAMILRTSVFSSLVIHQIPYLADMGIPYPVAASVLGIMALISVPGRLLFGWLGDMFNKRHLLFVACLLQALSLWIFINATTIGTVYLFVVIYGMGHGGTLPVHHGLRADLFGRRTFATMGGITTAITVIATVGAPVLAGYLYDVTQSYRVAFYVLLAAVSLAGFAFLSIRPPKLPARLTGMPVAG
ncbi:MFS transporter [Chloroflexota bacterium]